jgi:hypothetical protein
MRIKIVRILCIAVCCFTLRSVLAAPVIPTAPGTTWRYNMTEEMGKGLNVSNIKPDADGKIRVPVLYRLEGTEDVDGKDLLKFEMHRAGTITNTDLLTVDEHGITCWARVNLDGELVKFSPPQTMIAAPLKKGAAWNFDGNAGELKVQQHYDVAGEEKIELPAGKFQAFRIHGEQTTPNRMTIDRWFAPGIGIVKDVTTMQDAKGDLLQRISLELAEAPKIVECQRPLREAYDSIHIEHAGNLRAVAGAAFAARRKRQSCVDRGKHWRRFSSGVQNRRGLCCRCEPDSTRRIHTRKARRRMDAGRLPCGILC